MDQKNDDCKQRLWTTNRTSIMKSNNYSKNKKGKPFRKSPFDRLSDDLLQLIFEHLGIGELTRMRLVCKKWKWFLDQQKVLELVVKDHDFQIGDWSHTGRPVHSASVIRMDLFRTKSQLFKERLTGLLLFSNLRRLKISSFAKERFAKHLYAGFFDRLRNFIRLEHLDIEMDLDQQQSITHPNLRIIHVRFVEELDYLEINAPQLEALYCRGWFHMVKVAFPQSIKFLFSSFYSESNRARIDLTKFVNLERLHCNAVQNLSRIELAKFVKLQEFKFSREELQPEDYHEIRNFLVDLVGQKLKLKRETFKVLFFNEEMTDLEPFHAYDSRLPDNRTTATEPSDASEVRIPN